MLDPMQYIGDRIFDYIQAPSPGDYVVTLTFRLSFPKPLTSRPYDGPFIRLCGPVLKVYRGFSFDGASGPAIDGVYNMLAALIHDALYLAIGEGAKGLSYRTADRLYRQVCIAQGAGRIRAWTHWTALRAFGWAWRVR